MDLVKHPQAWALFASRRILFFTMHEKERAVAPVLQQHWGIECVVPPSINTDSFGTFSGEIPRVGTQLDAAEAKLRAASEQFPQEDAYLVSEGAFYPHPDSPFITVNTELLVLWDKKNNLRIPAWHTSLDTRARTQTIHRPEEIKSLLESFDFPTYGVLLSCLDHGKLIDVVKDVQRADDFVDRFLQWKETNPKLTIQISHDLRAHRNPTRMAHIEETARELVQHMNRICPNCGQPGFTPVGVVRGLPCGLCAMPTRMVRAIQYRCSSCGYETEQPPEDAPAAADPMYCDQCNP